MAAGRDVGRGTLRSAGMSDGDRERVVVELRRRAAAGELTAEELADRVRRVRSVVTMAGLEGVLLDLPGGQRGPARP